MITDVFLDQKRVNLCEHMVKAATRDSFEKCHQGGCKTGRERGGGKIKWKLSEVDTRAVS